MSIMTQRETSMWIFLPSTNQFVVHIVVLYSALISRNLNFADSSLQSFRWINFAVPFALPEVLSKLPHLQCVSWYTHAHAPYYHAHKLIWQLVRSCESKSEARWWRWLQQRTKWRLWSVAITYTQLCGMPRYCTWRNDSSKWAIRIRKLWIAVAWINALKVLQ